VGITRMRTRLHLWLAVVLVAQVCEMFLALFSGGQQTLGWFGARALWCGASVTLLCALLWDIHDIHRNLQRMNARLHEHATFDQLTGMLMRRPFFDRLAEAVTHWQDKGHACVVLMLDVDHFKQFNDAFGHMAGDVCLTTVAEAVRQCLPKRGAEMGRLGGEEFAVVLTGKVAEKPAAAAELVRSAVWRQHLPHARTAGQPWVTISVGWGVPEKGQTPQQFVDTVDQALYRAKAGGRNQVAGPLSLAPAFSAAA
jgi:diguanylate cyclase (GGDEF)-like protein